MARGSNHRSRAGDRDGWGSFAIEAVRKTDRVTSLTCPLSRSSCEKRIAAAGFADNIEVMLMDYRALRLQGCVWQGVSIEMLEAVGRIFGDVLRLHPSLVEERWNSVFQCITMPEGRYEAYAKEKISFRSISSWSHLRASRNWWRNRFGSEVHW